MVWKYPFEVQISFCQQVLHITQKVLENIMKRHITVTQFYEMQVRITHQVGLEMRLGRWLLIHLPVSSGFHMVAVDLERR